MDWGEGSIIGGAVVDEGAYPGVYPEYMAIGVRLSWRAFCNRLWRYLLRKLTLPVRSCLRYLALRF